MKKKCTVVMLPTKKKSKVYTSKEKTILGYSYSLKYGDVFKNDGLCSSYQHLYLISSDDEIKEGDWCFDIHGGELFQITDELTTMPEVIQGQCKKVIASTDPELFIQSGMDDGKHIISKTLLPRIPESFIKAYVEAGGIDEVMVEYEIPVNLTNATSRVYPPLEAPILKLTDNNEVIITHAVGIDPISTINHCEHPFNRIHWVEDVVWCNKCNTTLNKKVKEKMYSREEIVQILWDFNKGILDTGQIKWIEENL